MIRNKFRVKDIDKINLELKILINCLKITVMIYLVFSYRGRGEHAGPETELDV